MAILIKFGATNANVDFLLKEIDYLDEMTDGHGLIWNAICKIVNKGACPPIYAGGKMREGAVELYYYECVNCGSKGYGNNENINI